MELDKAIKSRHSVKKFKENKKPDWRDIIEAIDSSRYAPMAGNIFTLKFILIDDEEKIKKLADAAQQQFVGKVKYLVVICSNPSMLINAYDDKGEIYNKQQTGAAIQNFLLKLEDLKLSTCWIGYFEEDMVKRELKIPDNIQVEALFPIGYESEIKYTRKIKPNLENFLYFNSYGNKKMKVPQKIDV